MTQSIYLKNLEAPTRIVDAVLDTDAYNEIDDQFAIAYLLKNQDRIRIRGFCATPFFNEKSISPADGMEKSYHEIKKVLELAGYAHRSFPVCRGSSSYLSDENTPAASEAADFLVEISKNYTSNTPLYILAIGAITNVASAFLKCPDMKERTVVVWLGGHSLHHCDTVEFNMKQDIAAARVIFGCGVPLVQLPCVGVIELLNTTRFELEHWLVGKNPLADYLAHNTIELAESYAAGLPWSRTIWDVSAVAWLVNDGQRFLSYRTIPAPIPEYNGQYTIDRDRHPISYVYHVNRDALLADLFQKLDS